MLQGFSLSFWSRSPKSYTLNPIEPIIIVLIVFSLPLFPAHQRSVQGFSLGLKDSGPLSLSSGLPRVVQGHAPGPSIAEVPKESM